MFGVELNNKLERRNMEQEEATDLFSEKSEAYAKYRPEYPTEALDVILKPFKNQKKITVVDVGAGTGIASRLLAQRGAQVHAVEPNESMIKSADSHPNITFHQSSAENLPLESNTADIITSFQAFHWFNFKRSLKEFKRVLKPTGQLALIWNYWDTQHPFTSGYAQIIDEASAKNPHRVGPYSGISGKVKEFRVRLLWKFQYLPYYQDIQRHNFEYVDRTDLKDLIGSARSQSYILHEGKPWEELKENIKQYYNDNQSSAKLAYDINVFTAQPNKR